MMSARSLAKSSRVSDIPFAFWMFIYLVVGACFFGIYLLSRLGRYGHVEVPSWGSFIDDPVGFQLLFAWSMGGCFLPEPRAYSQIRPYPSAGRLVTGAVLFVVALMMGIVGAYAWDARACEYGGKISVVANSLLCTAVGIVSWRGRIARDGDHEREQTDHPGSSG